MKKSISKFVTRWMFTPLDMDKPIVYISYGNRMARYVWNHGRDPTWEGVPFKENKLLLILGGGIRRDKIVIRDLAGLSSAIKILKLNYPNPGRRYNGRRI